MGFGDQLFPERPAFGLHKEVSLIRIAITVMQDFDSVRDSGDCQVVLA